MLNTFRRTDCIDECLNDILRWLDGLLNDGSLRVSKRAAPLPREKSCTRPCHLFKLYLFAGQVAEGGVRAGLSLPTRPLGGRIL